MNAVTVSTVDDRLLVARFLRWLQHECGYQDVRLLPGGRWAALWSLRFSHAIIVGQVGNRLGVDDRWCYRSHASAKAALDAWDGSGDPRGWDRHPSSGRRRIAMNAD